jgi:hypothetical protein
VVPAEHGLGLGEEVVSEQLGQRDHQATGAVYRVALQAGKGQAGGMRKGAQWLRDRSDRAEIRTGTDDHSGADGSQSGHRLAEQFR